MQMIFDLPHAFLPDFLNTHLIFHRILYIYFLYIFNENITLHAVDNSQK